MFKIEDNVIYLTRGDKAVIELTIADYTFLEGDKIQFRIYKRKKLNESPILEKEIKIEEKCESIEIQLSSEETKIGEMVNIEQEYWYEIQLNNEQTLLGYDEDGAKKIILYPEGADKNV